MSDYVWTPSEEQVERANLTRLQRLLGANDYKELHRISIEEPDRFWPAVIDDRRSRRMCGCCNGRGMRRRHRDLGGRHAQGGTAGEPAVRGLPRRRVLRPGVGRLGHAETRPPASGAWRSRA